MTSSSNQVGKVYLVGAGPGHPQLLTLKAYELITQADILIYDRLIQEDVLAAARPDVELIYVGKQPGRHQSMQADINTTLVEAAHRAALVVRLKGGDPILFGRGGEEAEALAEHGIPFEVVPGVTAGLSVPMAASIPVTHRDCSHNVALVTGHSRGDKEGGEQDWEALARMDTLVFFMSVGKLPHIAERLIANGLAADTPAAVIQQAYWPGEHLVVGTLSELPGLAKAAGIKPPATIVIGQVVSLRARLSTHVRDLHRGSDEKVGFGMSAETLLDKASNGLRVAKDLLAAVRLDLFADLEHACTAKELASKRRLAQEPLAQVLSRLASLGLLLHSGGTYRNAEAASRFLRRGAPEYLGVRLEEMVARADRYDPLVRLRSH